jgi:predicted NAD/FAD-binding protein
MRKLCLSPPAPAISEVARFAGESGRNLVAIDLCSAYLPQGVALLVSDAADENLDEGVIAAQAVDARSARLLQQPSMATRSLLNGGEVRRQLLHLFIGRSGLPQAPKRAAARGGGLKSRFVQVLIWLEKLRYSGQGVVSLKP